MNMIERVARAIEVASHGPQSLVDVPYDEYLHSIAKAAIEAMKEPTEDMLDASWKLTGESKEMRVRTHCRYARHYAAMINAALEEKRDD